MVTSIPEASYLFYVTKMMLTGLSIIFIGILLNMAGQKEQVTGLTPAFIVMLYEAFIPRIGEIMKVMISRGLNNTTNALPYGRHILPSYRFLRCWASQ